MKLFNRSDLLPLRISAMWFVVAAMWFSMLSGDYSFGMNLLHILGGGFLVTGLINFWNIRREKDGGKLMDERKQRLTTRAMAWAFAVTMTALLIAAKTIETPEPDLLQDVIELGFWTWLIVFSAANLRHKYGSVSDE